MKFWDFKDLDTEAEMRLEGPISEDTWWGDEVTPQLFRNELSVYDGKPLTIWINSPGGDVFAASQIYTAIMERKGPTNVKIDGIAASAASVIAMAGDKVEMSPTAIMMIHNPLAMAMGNVDDFKQIIDVLKEVKETIVNAYEIKSQLPRDEIARLMDKETYMNAKKAVQLGFADSVLYTDGEPQDIKAMQFSANKYSAQICARMKEMQPLKDEPEEVITDLTTKAQNILNYMEMEMKK